MDIYLTSQEALYGCQKVVSLPGQVSPLKLELKPGMRNNTKLVVKNARFYGRNGIITTIPVKVTIHVEQVRQVNTAAPRPKRKHRVLKFIALLWFVGLCVAVSSMENQKKTSSNPSSTSGGGITTSTRTDTPSSSGQQNSSNAPGQAYTDIPASLCQEGWATFGAPEYCPKFEFFADGQCDMWINLGYDYCKMSSTYKVYQYSSGLRAIACDISALQLDNRLWHKIYLLESKEGVWDYRGTPTGFSDISCRFVTESSNILSVPTVSVREPNLSTDYIWMTEGGEDDLSFNWVSSGKVSFNFGIYRMFSYENQVGFCAPDGAVYCFLNDVENTEVSQADGLVRLTFQERSISLEFLSAIDSDYIYLQDYVGQTYTFR